MKKINTINRRETTALLDSGLFSLHDLNNFNYSPGLTKGKSLKKINGATNGYGTAMKTIGIIGGIGPLCIAGSCNGEDSKAQDPVFYSKSHIWRSQVHFSPDAERSEICSTPPPNRTEA